MTIKDLGPYTCQAYNGFGRGDSWTILVEAKRGIGLILHEGDEEFEKYLIPITGEETEPRSTEKVIEVEAVTASATILPSTQPTVTETTTLSEYTNYLGIN